MKINLRKAKALQEQILAEIKNINLNNSVKLTEFDTDPSYTIKKAIDQFEANYETIRQLYEIYYNIRSQVAELNADTGISKILAEIAYVEKLIGVLQSNIPKTVDWDIEVINAKLSQIKNTPFDKRLYGFQDSINISIFDDIMLQNYKINLNELKRKKIKLQDKLLHLNIVCEIVISEEVVHYLEWCDLM